MNKKIMITLLAIAPFIAAAQLGAFINKVKNKVNQRVDNKVDKAIDKTLDHAEGKGNADGASDNPRSGSDRATAKSTEGVKSFSKYDFVPGEKILYAEDFAQEPHAFERVFFGNKLRCFK